MDIFQEENIDCNFLVRAYQHCHGIVTTRHFYQFIWDLFAINNDKVQL